MADPPQTALGLDLLVELDCSLRVKALSRDSRTRIWGSACFLPAPPPLISPFQWYRANEVHCGAENERSSPKHREQGSDERHEGW